MARSGLRGGILRDQRTGARRRLGPVQFFVEVWMELRRAEWPTRKESFRLTGIVIALAAAIAVTLGIIDFLFNLLGRSFLG